MPAKACHSTRLRINLEDEAESLNDPLATSKATCIRNTPGVIAQADDMSEKTRSAESHARRRMRQDPHTSNACWSGPTAGNS
jgi:hypothetical protein